MTELLALCNGLSLAWDKRFKKLIVKMDSFKSIRLVLRYDYGNLRLANVVLQCQRLLHSNWKVKLQYVWWEGNQVVDKLANLAVADNEDVSILTTPHVEVRNLLMYDQQQVAWPRAILI